MLLDIYIPEIPFGWTALYIPVIPILDERPYIYTRGLLIWAQQASSTIDEAVAHMNSLENI